MPNRLTFEAIGTLWKIDAPESVLPAIKERIAVFDKAYSRFRPDSLVSEMARTAGEHRLPDDARPMMELYRSMYDLTGGLMTPLVGQVLVDAGYDAEYSLVPQSTIVQAPAWDDVMSYAHPILTLKKPVLLDFGAIGKGYLVDIVAGILREHGVTEYTVDAGGDIAHRSASEGKGLAGKTLRIGLEDPTDATKAVGVAEIKNESLCGSAGNRRAWDRFHHIINPQTIESPRHILGLWTVAETTALADALSTALFFVGAEALTKKYRFEFAVLFADRSAVLSKGFPGSFFSE